MGQYFDGYDYPAIHEYAKEIMKHRKHLKKSAMDRYTKYFDEKCAISKARVEPAKALIPGGIQHNLANNHPFPLSIAKAEGPYLYDEDGNRYIDLLMAGGPTILGNNFPTVRDTVCDFIRENGPVTGMYSEKERELAELVTKYYPSCEMFRMLGSGTEADIIGIRLARAFTGRTHIVRIRGGYHGWSDQLVYNSDAIDNGTQLNGIPKDCFQNTHAIMPNDAEDLERTIVSLEDKGGVAAFVMEAVGQDSGALPTTREFHKKAAEICKKHGVLLIYDEVVTGFRLGLGGAQSVMGTKPDLTIFGKIIGGGYPAAGGIGGRRDIMSRLAAGIGAQPADRVRVGGTLSANPMTALAGITTIKELARLNAHEKMAKAADYFIHGIAELTQKYDVPCLCFNQQSILHIDPHAFQHIAFLYEKDDPEYAVQVKDAYMGMIEFAMALAAEGVIISGGGKTYICYDSIPILDDALAAYERVFKEFE